MSEHTLLTDAALVAGHLAGDRAAFAAIYDRYGAGLYDVAAAMLRNRHDAADVTQDTFVVAAERMGQLRDPERLKPWLLAILRNEVYRRTGKRNRQIPTDFTLVEGEMAPPRADPDGSSAVEYTELATLVREAAAGLEPRDQLVLELAVRQDLDGEELAAALGVSVQQSYSLLHRMRQRTERSLGAFCVARRGRRDCAQLDAILAGWDGTFSVLIRKRVARHIDDCDVCERNRKTFVPLALFGAAPVLAAPPDLRDRVLSAVDAGSFGLTSSAVAAQPYGFTAPGGFPSALSYSRRVVLWWLMGAAALMLALGAAVFLAAGDRGAAAQLAIDVPAPPSSTTTTTTSSSTSTTLPATTTVPVAVPPTGPATTPPSTPPTTALAAATTTLAPRKTTTTAVTTTTSTTTTTTEPPAATTTTTTTTGAPTSTTDMPTTTAGPTTTVAAPVPPGALALSSSALDFGTSASALTVQLVNEGSGPAVWSAAIAPGFAGGTPFSVSPASGNLAPGAIQTLTVSFDRTGLAEPSSHTATIRFTATGTATALTARGSVPGDTTPPVVRVASIEHAPCAGTVTVTVTADDPESGIAAYAGTVTWGSSSATLTFNGNVGSAQISPPPIVAAVPPITANVTVRNGAGLSTNASGSTAPGTCIG